MNTIKNLYLEVYRSNNDNMVVIHSDFDKNSNGLSYIWFAFTEEEFIALCERKRRAYEDGYHKLETFGESWTFYRTDTFPNDSRGIAEVPYTRITVPLMAAKMMLRMAKRVWKAQHNHQLEKTSELRNHWENVNHYQGERICIEFSHSRCDRLIKLYGQGKGNVKLSMGEETRKFFDQVCAEDFKRNIERLETIAKNTTQAYFETATVDLSKDWDGFYFQIYTPNGRKSLVGGLINHGKDKPDWSIHT